MKGKIIKMTLSEKIKEERNKMGYSQEKIAELVGVSRQAVTKWESGQSVPSMENLIALAGILEISLSELTSDVYAADTQGTSNKVENRKGTIKLIFAIILFIVGIMSVVIISNMSSLDITRLTGVWIGSAHLVRLGVQVGGGMAIFAAAVLFMLYMKSSEKS
jgi:transcriptional regulator with XRE-family HTH domain